MDAVADQVRTSLADPPVAALALAPTDLLDRAVHTDEVDIQPGQQASEIPAPRRELNDVINDQVVPSLGQRGQAPVKPGKETRPASHATS
jgi:hypothetical protein